MDAPRLQEGVSLREQRKDTVKTTTVSLLNLPTLP